jgi:hypothetical protein
MVKSKQIYTTQSFCDTFLGFCPMVNGDEDELRLILDQDERFNDLWDYPLDEIEHIVENNLNVVLVDTSYVDDDTYELVTEYRWFEVPEV